MIVVHGSNCRCPMVISHAVMLPGAIKGVYWIRQCALDPGFWTPERLATLRKVREILDAEPP